MDDLHKEIQKQTLVDLYQKQMENWYKRKRNALMPTLMRVLAERFSPEDLEIYRAWKVGAIRKIPLKTEIITKVGF